MLIEKKWLKSRSLPETSYVSNETQEDRKVDNSSDSDDTNSESTEEEQASQQQTQQIKQTNLEVQKESVLPINIKYELWELLDAPIDQNITNEAVDKLLA